MLHDSAHSLCCRTTLPFHCKMFHPFVSITAEPRCWHHPGSLSNTNKITKTSSFSILFHIKKDGGSNERGVKLCSCTAPPDLCSFQLPLTFTALPLARLATSVLPRSSARSSFLKLWIQLVLTAQVQRVLCLLSACRSCWSLDTIVHGRKSQVLLFFALISAHLDLWQRHCLCMLSKSGLSHSAVIPDTHMHVYLQIAVTNSASAVCFVRTSAPGGFLGSFVCTTSLVSIIFYMYLYFTAHSMVCAPAQRLQMEISQKLSMFFPFWINVFVHAPWQNRE